MSNLLCKGYHKSDCGQAIFSDGLCKNCRAAKFEDDVADVFRLMGFVVEKNKHMGGRQVDMYIEFRQGIVSVNAVVECKYHKASNVGAEEVSQVAATAGPWIRTGKLQKAYLITTQGFAAPARQNAQMNGIECFTYDELLSSLIDFNPYLKRLVEDFESSKLFNTYVDLRVTRLVSYDKSPDRIEPLNPYYRRDWEPVRKKLLPFMKRWLTLPESYHVSILGDFGAGKTSFCTYFSYICAKRHLENPTRYPRIPLLVRLSNFARLEKGSVQAMITDFLVNDCNLQTNYATFRKFLSSGKFLLLLDGFDEMSMQVDERIRLRNFEILAELAQPGNKVILTGRTGYFPSLSEIRKVMRHVPVMDNPYERVKNAVITDGTRNVRYDLLKLEPFSALQIDSFLKNHIEQLQSDGVTNWQEMRDAIRSTYNLNDLARRPVLLEIMIQTIPRLKGEVRDLNLFRLYDMYTKLWLQRDWEKGEVRQLLTTEQRRLFMQELALYMYRSGVPSIHFTNLPDRIQSHFKIREKSTLDYFDHDVRTCTFLNRTDDGHYRFVHKSFMEYFVATAIVDSLQSKKLPMLDDIGLTSEVIAFVGAGISKEETDVLLDFISIERTATYNDNVMRIAAASSHRHIINKDFTKADFNGVRISNITFESCDFDSCSFRRAQLHTIRFVNCNLREADFRDASLVQTEFVGCKLKRVNFREAVFGIVYTYVRQPKKSPYLKCGTVTFRKCDLRYADMRGESFTNSCFASSDLSQANLQNTFFHRCDFEGARFKRSNLNEAQFAGCNISDCSFLHTYMRRAKFIAYRRNTPAPYSLWYHSATKDNVNSNEFIGSVFIGCNLRQSVFTGQFIKDANFQTSILSEAGIYGCLFVCSPFNEIDLSRTRVIGSNWINCVVGTISTEKARIIRSSIR